jgi:hypothetical protein
MNVEQWWKDNQQVKTEELGEKTSSIATPSVTSTAQTH